METCGKCQKRFKPTSWTKIEFWLGICPACIVEMLEESDWYKSRKA